MGHLVTTDTPCQVIHLTNDRPEFYPTLGPFLARRAIARELGGPIWDEDGARWFVALAPDGAVMGFASLRERAKVHWLDNTYVLPAWRERGVYRRLLEARLAECPPGAVVRAVCTEQSIGPLLRRGFAPRRQRGRWAEVEKIIGGDTTRGDATE